MRQTHAHAGRPSCNLTNVSGSEGQGDTMKDDYTAPKLTRLGDLASLTAGQDRGTKLDQDFSAGTDFGDLTFS